MKNAIKMKMNWIAYSIIAAISFAVMIMLYKQLLLMGINQNILNLSVFGFVFVGFAAVAITNKNFINLTPLMLALLVLASVFSLIGNYYNVKALNEAPNPGYSITIVSTQLVLISLLSILFFNSDFTWTKFIGITIVIFGSYLVGV